MNITTIQCTECDKEVTVISLLNKVEAKAYAIRKLQSYFPGVSTGIDRNSKIISHQSFNDELYIPYRDGNIQYKVSFELENEVQRIDMSSTSPLSAYNNIKLKYGIQRIQFAVIIDTTTNNNVKKSLKVDSQSLFNDKNTLYNSVQNIIKRPDTDYNMHNVCQLITALINGQISLTNDAAVEIVSVIVYRYSNNEYKLDICQDTDGMTPVEYTKFINNKYRFYLPNMQ